MPASLGPKRTLNVRKQAAPVNPAIPLALTGATGRGTLPAFPRPAAAGSPPRPFFLAWLPDRRDRMRRSPAALLLTLLALLPAPSRAQDVEGYVLPPGVVRFSGGGEY